MLRAAHGGFLKGKQVVERISLQRDSNKREEERMKGKHRE